MKSSHYDIVVIGGGASGLVSSKVCNGLGKKVALIEKNNKLGGECTWTGCIPSKTLIKSAQVAHYAKNLKKFGLSTSQEINVNTNEIFNYIKSVANEVYNSHKPEVIEKLGIKIIFGSPCFVDNHTIKIDNKKITAKKFIICSGSLPFIPTIDGIEKGPYLTNENIWDLKELPKSIIILGGGPIGVELASALNRLGVEVSIVECEAFILAKEDKELVEILMKKMRQEGIKIYTNTKVVGVDYKQDFVSLNCVGDNQKHIQVQAEKLLVATGRKPNVETLNLENVGVEYNRCGIKVNNKMQTTVSNIYASGDVVGPFQFSHMAQYQATIAAKNACIPFFKSKTNYDDAIWVTFVDPELATLGKSEEAAKKEYGDSIKIFHQHYDYIDRSHCDENLEGLAKIICDKKGNIIGCTILGARAGEVIHEIQTAKQNGVKLHNLYKIIHAYPTYNDIIKSLAKQAYIDRLENNMFIKILKKIFRINQIN